MNRRLRKSLFVQALEDRTTPASFTVMNLNDNGTDSLRDCIGKANAAAGTDTIDFKAGLTGTITLTSGEIAISGALTVLGPGATNLTLSGNNTSRIFNTQSAAAGSAISLSGLTLTNATATSFGGAILAADESLTFDGCVFSANKSVTKAGGAIGMLGAGTLTARDCTFTNNVASTFAGGIVVAGATNTTLLQRCTFSGNTAGSGGAMYVYDNLIMESCTLSGNSATTGKGGAIYCNASGSITQSTLSGNSAATDGGAVSLFIHVASESLVIRNSTITNNSAGTGSGGGVRRVSTIGSISIESCIISGNINSSAPDISSTGTVFVKTSAVGSGTGFTKTDAGGNLPFQPHANLKLSALADNGGPMLTHLPALDSPLVNAGSNPAALTTDQRGIGFPRIISSAPDIGSVEVRVFVVVNTNDSGTGSLRQAVLDANSLSGPDTVSFDATVFAAPQTIKLTTGEITINEAVTVLAPAGKLTIDGNAASRMFNTSGAPAGAAILLQGLTITNGVSASKGGAILITDEAVTIQGCSLTNNSAFSGTSGGAIAIVSGSLVIEDCLLSGNKSSVGDGGAIAVFSAAAATIRRSTLSGNTAGGSGGAIYFKAGGGLTIEESTLSGNTGNDTNGFGGGGAIYYLGTATKLLISNSTLSGNSAPNVSGGAICWQGSNGTAVIQNSTITNNGAKNNGGGIISLGSGTFSLRSTIVAGNSATGSPDISLTSSTTIAGDNNLIGVADAGGFTLTGTGNQTGTKAAPLNAKLVPLANNGGPTLTHALLAGSPALNKGNNVAGLTFDQRGSGFPRQIGTGVEIGSYELDPNIPQATGTFADVTTAGATLHSIAVTFTDDTAINVATIDDADIRVTGPGFNALAFFDKLDTPGNGTPRTATYTFTPPGGAWDVSDNGIYTVSVEAGQVSDTGGKFVVGGSIGTFAVAIPITYLVDITLDENDGNFNAGDLSLREAIVKANSDAAPSFVVFSASVFASPQTIKMTTALGNFAITQPVSITGPAAKLTIDAQSATIRHFDTSTAAAASSINIANLTLINGKVTTNGGSISAGDESLTLTNVTITNCTTSADGGAISTTSGTLKLDSCTITGNSATGASSNGGGINTSNGTVVVNTSIISGNTAGEDGGGIYFFSGGTLVMDDSTLSGNNADTLTAGAGGGGIGSFSTTVTIRNSTISGNVASNGGGIGVLSGGATLIQNSTIAFNTAATSGGGITRPNAAAITIESTIVSNNTAPTGPDVNGTVGTMNTSLVSNSAGLTIAAGADNRLDQDAKLKPLAANGGPTPTHLPNPDSPVFNAGSNSGALSFDQRGNGFSRVLQGFPDIGAVESVGAIPTAKATAAVVTTAGATIHTITVHYADDVEINTTTLGSSDITVKSAGSVTIPVTFTGFTGGGTSVTATYDMIPPGGAWDPHDFGAYTVVMNAGEVADTDGTPNTVLAGNIGIFNVAIVFDPVVSLTTDESDGNFAANDISLREAVIVSNSLPGAQLITFDPGVFGTPQTIMQTLQQINITDSATITGPAAKLTINAGGLSRHFNIDGAGTLTVSISKMTLTNGNSGTGDGGSVRIADELVTLSSMTFTGNKAAVDGGALTIAAATSVVTISDSTFSGNSATSSGGHGGAINLDTTGALIVARSTFSGNTAGDDGGAIYFFSGGSLTMTDSTVSGNISNTFTTSVGGGGIYFFGTVAAGGFTITNSTISGNTVALAGSGGGIVLAAFSGNAVIQNSTIVGNKAVSAGGGIARTSGTGTLTLQSTIVAGNLVAGGNNAKSDLSFDAVTAVAGSNNLVGIQEASNNASLTGSLNLTGSLATPLNAKLGPLANNGGPTLTHALLGDSPAIDKGNNSAGLSFDQRGAGFARNFNGTDIGAFELQPVAPPTVTSILLNDSANVQRSLVTSIKVSFSEAVNFPSGLAAAFVLERTASGSPGAVGLTFSPSNGPASDVTITFNNTLTVNIDPGGSLADGKYLLTIVADKIVGVGGTLDGDDDLTAEGSPTDNKTTSFHRLFGDVDGNGTVNSSDFATFRIFFGIGPSIFDFNNDGQTNSDDFAEFRKRFGLMI